MDGNMLLNASTPVYYSLSPVWVRQHDMSPTNDGRPLKKGWKKRPYELTWPFVVIGSALRAGSRLTSQNALKAAYRCNSTTSAPAKKSFSKWSLFKGVVKFGTVAFIGYGGYGKWGIEQL